MIHLRRRDVLALMCATTLSQAVAAQDRQPSTRLTIPPPPKQLPPSWSKAEVIPLWPGKPPGSAGYKPQALPHDWPAVFMRNVASPTLHVFSPARSNGQALLVVPGGAYVFVSGANEGAELAERMNALGITVFVLTYRLPGEGWGSRADVPLQDAQRAMRLIRSQATRFKINADTLSVLGFSAGGHLAATLATGHAERVYAAVDAVDQLNARPFAAGLVYPVVTMKEPWTHADSRRQLLGEFATDSEVARRSAELHVAADTPPVFVAHAMDDDAVPVENTLQFMEAMRRQKRPIEAHLLQEGGHAFGVGYPNTPSAHWIGLFDVWLARLRLTYQGPQE